MAFFEKISKAATNLGKSTLNAAVTVGSQASVAAQDKTKLTELKAQVNVIQQELDASYVQIGKRYVDYVIASGEMPGIDVSDVLNLIDPKLTLKDELEKEIIALEKKIKNNAMLREKQAAEETAKKLKGILLKINVKAGENGKIFGGVTAKEIADTLKTQANIEVDKKKIELKEQIKTLGTFSVNVKLYEGVTGVLKVDVLAK